MLWAIAISLAAAADPTTTTAPATAPAQRHWGETTAGLSASAAPAGAWRLAGQMKLDFALRNTGTVPATLPQAAGVFGYLLLAQGKTIHYTEKIFHAGGMADWPARLGEGGILRLPPVDLARLKAFRYEPGMALKDGYPATMTEGKPQPQPAAGDVGEILKPGAVKVKYIVNLTRPREGTLRLVGNTIRLELTLSDFARLPDERQRQILADLAQRLRKNPWSAKLAHGDAVRIGRAAADTLITVNRDLEAPYFARMWAAAALAKVGGKKAARTLTDCLGDSVPGVRHAAAYHGPRLGDQGLDKALNQRALAGEDAMLTAWTIMGYLKFRGRVPPELLKAGVESDEWRVRAAVVEVFARASPGRSHLPILRKLATDPNPQIRRTAARAIQYVGDRSYETIDALIAALAMPGDDARHHIARALAALTGKKWPYEPAASEAEKTVMVRQWGKWWELNKGSYRKPKPQE